MSVATHMVAHSVHGSSLVRGLNGHLFHRLPTPYGEVWWFDRQWNPVPDPTVEYAPVDLLKLAHDEADKADTVSKCYFIGGETGPVKIGHSVDVKRRLRDIQMCSPVTLSVLALTKGGLYRESAYHMQFEDYRLHGEWFERSPEIEAEIARLNAESA